VPELPGKLLLNGDFDKSIEVMTAHNENEGVLFATPFATDDNAIEAYLKAAVPSISDMALKIILTSVYPPVFDGTYSYTSEFDRVSLIVGEAFFACNTRYLDVAFGSKTYSYEFAGQNKGFHGEDLTYTFFNGPSSQADGGTVNATVAMAMQSYITNFVATSNPNGDSVPYFPPYGTNSSQQVVNISEFGSQITDPEDNKRCEWWQTATVYDS
jgi:carboxylesterase type B